MKQKTKKYKESEVGRIRDTLPIVDQRQVIHRHGRALLLDLLYLGLLHNLTFLVLHFLVEVLLFWLLSHLLLYVTSSSVPLARFWSVTFVIFLFFVIVLLFVVLYWRKLIIGYSMQEGEEEGGTKRKTEKKRKEKRREEKRREEKTYLSDRPLVWGGDARQLLFRSGQSQLQDGCIS